MNILTIKEGRSEVTINVDKITHMEFMEGKESKKNALMIHFETALDLVFEGESARAIQWEVDMLMAKVSGETAIVELVETDTTDDVFNDGVVSLSDAKRFCEHLIADPETSSIIKESAKDVGSELQSIQIHLAKDVKEKRLEHDYNNDEIDGIRVHV